MVWIQIKTDVPTSVGPDLGPNCLQRLSAYDKINHLTSNKIVLPVAFFSEKAENMSFNTLHIYTTLSYVH